MRKRVWVLLTIGFCLAACAGPSWRETNVNRSSPGSVPRDAYGNPVPPDGQAR